MRQFHRGDVLGGVTAALDDSGLPPDRLELEITESLLMADTEHAFQLLKEVRSKGISVAIDDFGTGYSSLNHLKQLPVDTLKIDRSFVRDLAHDSEDAAIVIAIISLAETLKLKVVAEGVETAEQLEFLKQHGCHEVQGYYLGRPMPAEEFERLLAGTGPSVSPKALNGVESTTTA
jgi:EAL domain-containing protein (putative c-di-GMP-specific phosphodiesterase class I)